MEVQKLIQDKAKAYAEANYQQFWDVENINELYKAFLAGYTQRDLEGSPSAGVWVNGNALPKQVGKYIIRIVDPKTEEEKNLISLNGTWLTPDGKMASYNIPRENYIKYEWLDESPSIPTESEPPVWYTKQQMYMWLIGKNYSHDIATELSEQWAKDLQGAFKKGWEKATNDNNPDRKDYKYYDPESEKDKRIESLEKELQSLKDYISQMTDTTPD